MAYGANADTLSVSSIRSSCRPSSSDAMESVFAPAGSAVSTTISPPPLLRALSQFQDVPCVTDILFHRIQLPLFNRNQSASASTVGAMTRAHKRKAPAFAIEKL